MLSKLVADVRIVRERDPAACGMLDVLVNYPGLHAVVIHRVLHWAWSRSGRKRRLVVRWMSQLARFATGVEIHPGASLGKGVFIDHGMGVVIGETAIVGDYCLLYQGVTLGGTGKHGGKRHPTLEDNVVVGAGAKILGAIVIGANTRVGAGSVVLKDVPENSTVVGIPGRCIKSEGSRRQPLAHSDLPDTEAKVIKILMDRIDELEGAVEKLSRKLGLDLATEGDAFRGQAQSLKDKEIIAFVGDQEE